MQAEAQKMISVVVNGSERQVNEGTLDTLLELLDFGDAKCATAVNGDFVAASARSQVRLKSGDTIEIVTARQGG